MHWHIQYPAGTPSTSYFTLTCLVYIDALIIPDGPWQGRGCSLNPESLETEAVQPSQEKQIPCKHSLPFVEVFEVHTHNIQSCLCSTNYGLIWRQSLLRSLWIVSRFIFLWHSKQPNLTGTVLKDKYSKHKISPPVGCSKTVFPSVYPTVIIYRPP